MSCALVRGSGLQIFQKIPFINASFSLKVGEPATSSCWEIASTVPYKRTRRNGCDVVRALSPLYCCPCMIRRNHCGSEVGVLVLKLHASGSARRILR